MRTSLPAAITLCLLAANLGWASTPGQPLDCSDWTFVEPGLSCSEVVARPCEAGSLQPWCLGGQEIQADNEGRLLSVQLVNAVPNALCGGGFFSLDQVRLLALSGTGVEQTLASLDDRCGAGQNVDRAAPSHQRAPSNLGVFTFVPTTGSLYLALRTECIGMDCGGQYASGVSLLKIDGFATTFDVIQTFQLASGTFSFRVPYMPYGLEGADAFDSYFGSLDTVGDWTQLQPLNCDYPATAPEVGDYLTIAPTLPDPVPGEGLYFLTAAVFQGETRFGRQRLGGQLSGRDSSQLPGLPVAAPGAAHSTERAISAEGSLSTPA